MSLQVEDLFYNVPTRRRAFRSSSEEYAKILDVVGRYAVHCLGVALSCRKHGDSGVSIATSAQSSAVDRIRQIHGSAVANELVSFDVNETKWGCRASGWASNANYHAKRTAILLFINHRAVESSTVRKAIEQTYSAFLPKGGHPFVYLDLEIEPQRVDVNIHPTKREVNFLNEDEIIESVCDAIRAKLATVDSSRTFMTQTLLPGLRTTDVPIRNTGPRAAQDGGSTARTPASTKRQYENNLIRTDSKLRKITSMLPMSTAQHGMGAEGGSQASAIEPGEFQYELSGRESMNIRLSSLKILRAEVRSMMHNNLTEIFSSLTYVGLVDERRRIAAIQSGVKLYLVNYGMICTEFFFQLGLTDFGNFGVINLESSPNLVDLISLAAVEELRKDASEDNPAIDDAEFEINQVDVDRITATVANHLIERREMLNEYFSISISEDGSLLSLPLLMKGYMPSLSKLPHFLLRLGPYVDWTTEEECFRTLLLELARFYTPEHLPPPPNPNTSTQTDPADPGPSSIPTASSSQSLPNLTQPSSNNSNESASPPEIEDEAITRRREQLSWMLEHVLFPAIRSRLVGTTDMEGWIHEVADLKGLYRDFERC